MTEGQGAEARETVYAYNSLNHLQSVTDALNRTTTFTTDDAGRIRATELPDNRVIGFDYDPKGNLTGVTPPGRPEHELGYDKVDNETAYTPPAITEGTGNIATHYNKDQQITQTAHDQGAAIGYQYDTAGRLEARTQPDGGHTYHYDSAGRTQSIATQSGETLSYSYDGFLETSETWSGTVNGTVATEYDNDLDITRHIVNGSHVIGYQYDDDGLLTRAGDLSLTRDPQNGLLTQTQLGSVTTTHQYNAFGELIQEAASYGGTPFYEVVYIRDKLGRITQKAETIEGLTTTFDYGYDQGNRLIEVRKDGSLTQSWDYDGNGNRIQTLGQDVATYDAQDRLLSYLVANRNLPGDVELGYLIDGKDRRIGKTVNGSLSQGFLYKDQLNPIAELDGAGQVKSLFVYADKGYSPAYMVQGGMSYRIVSDHLGSPRLVVDVATGQVVQRLDYDVWGNVEADTNPGLQPLGFAGGLQDAHTGLVRFGARDYDPVTGRWTGKDPIGFNGGEPNFYGYVLLDPANNTDPLGLDSWYCKRPLGGEPGSKGAHHYICIDMPDGSRKCDSTNAGPDYPTLPWDPKPGVPSDPAEDYYDPVSCE